MREIQKIRFWQHSPQATYQASLERIAATKMKNLPVCNRKIRVQVLSFVRYKGHWFGVVITPWSIFVVMACGDPHSWPHTETTQFVDIKLPAGEFTFTGMDDEYLGKYLACSLMSPVDPMFDQTSAVQFSTIAFSSMMSQPEPNNQSSAKFSNPRRQSRRHFLFMNNNE